MSIRILKSSLFINLLFLSFPSFAQNNNADKENIAKHLEDYFFLERENIHLQLNKTTYISTEDIWFSGYVYHRKKNIPFFSTTNVLVVFYDDEGNKIQDQLLFAKEGSFSGKLALGDEFKSGKYYIQVFTNWMNNFKEDESSLFEVSILNANDKSFQTLNKHDYSKINVHFFPEGGALIDGITNSIGIKVSDANGNPLPLSEIVLIDNENNPTQKILLNKYGFGKFQFLANKSSKIQFSIEGQKIEKSIPATVSSGLSLEINNYALKDKTIAKIRTNKNSIETFKTKKLYMVVHQDNKFNIFDVNFSDDKLEQTIIFTNDNLFEGVNSIRIIDSDKKQFAERQLFKYPETFLNLNIETLKKENDSILLKGNLNIPENTFSISVLPEKNLDFSAPNSIFSSFLIAPYIKEKCLDSNYYFESITKSKQYEIDLFLLNQNSSKYRWENIVSAPPKEDNTFDFGISLKGTLNQVLKDRTKFKTKLYSIAADISETSEINEKNEFFFNNLILSDSTSVNFSLINEQNKAIPLNLYPQVLNGRRRFNKPFSPLTKDSLTAEKTEYELPEMAIGSITINTVEIDVIKKPKLTNAALLENANLRGYKVPENDNTDVLRYIGNHGFKVHTEFPSNEVHIHGRSIATFNGAQKSPVLYIDGMQQMDFDILLNMRMTEVDEIYLNANISSPAGINTQGVIKIYKRFSSKYNSTKNPARTFEIKNAFSRSEKFKNTTYASTDNKGFQNFGVIDWIPSIATKNGNFTFKIPDMNQKKVKILIEGFSVDGKLISEIRTIDLP